MTRVQIDQTRAVSVGPSPSLLMSQVTNSLGFVDFDRVAGMFWMTKGQLAETIGLTAPAITKSDRQTAMRTQSRVREMLEIVARVREWAGGDIQAMAWYRSQPIPALDGRTPEALVKAGQASSVRNYLDHLALGGFA
jgi:uncharacterized protein (DUF2384 family)